MARKTNCDSAGVLVLVSGKITVRVGEDQWIRNVGSGRRAVPKIAGLRKTEQPKGG